MDQAIINLIVQVVYYLVAVVLAFLGIFGIYVVMRFGQRRSISLAMSIVFAFIFLQLVFQSYLVLQTL
jgi:hypothetical protein